MKQIGKMLYVAGKYSGDINKNISNAEEISINLIRNGFHVLTPHKNTSGYEKYEGDGISYGTWICMDLDLLSRCDAIYVMKNSSNSKGVQQEIEFATENAIPILYETDHPTSVFTLKIFKSIIQKRNWSKEIMKLTPRQQEYLNELADGPKTTRDIEISMKVSRHTAAKTMKKLRDMGMVKSKRVPMQHGNMWRHEIEVHLPTTYQ